MPSLNLSLYQHDLIYLVTVTMNPRENPRYFISAANLSLF